MRPVSASALATTACVLSLLGCCPCGKSAGAKLPATVPVYPGSTAVSQTEVLGVTLAHFTAPASAQVVKDYYDTSLAPHWEAASPSSWELRTEMAGSRFEYRRFRQRDGKAYLYVELLNSPTPHTIVDVKYCPDGPIHCNKK